MFGLIQGGLVSYFANPRVALSAHLTAVQSGMAIVIAGIVWPAVDVAAGLKAIAKWSIAGGMYGLWVALTLSAMTGASEPLPIAGRAKARASRSNGVTALILSSSLAMTVGWVILVIGLLSRTVDQR